MAGTALSVAVTAAWSWTATMTIGPAESLHLGRNLPADYARLADAATGNGRVLFAVTAGIYFGCFLVSGLRQRRRNRAAAALRARAGAVAEPFAPRNRNEVNARQWNPPRPGPPEQDRRRHARLPGT